MAQIHEIHVRHKTRDIVGEGVRAEAQRTLGIDVGQVSTTRVYRLEGATDRQAEMLAQRLFTDPLTQESSVFPDESPSQGNSLEVAYKPGVMNPEAASIMKAAQDLGVPLLAADSSTRYSFSTAILDDQVHKVADRLLVNKTVQRIIDKKPDTLIVRGSVGPVEEIPIRDINDGHGFVEVNNRLGLSLDPEEMWATQRYFRREGREPTDCELQIVDGYWSEHCGHKTFNSEINNIYLGRDMEIGSDPLFKRIKDTARQYFGDLVVSAFNDNSGAIRFYDGMVICGKVETHNSPSAIEPYGGAATGSGGVFRDALGTGQGAKLIASTDVFVFGPLDLDPRDLPPGCLPPDYLERRVVDGVRDYGNRMGIPTANGSVHHHFDSRAKPSVIVGAYSITEERYALKGEPQINDLVVVIGGRTGRDGIHGATFSSTAMTDTTITINSQAVQIGNAIEEKRMADAVVEARDRNLIRAITDCGAAGFSSAIGEMGENIGVDVDISRAPLKYEGLAPWEIWMSESQERMILAIDPSNIDEFIEVCKKYNTEATVLGHFDGSNKLKVKFGDQMVADLDYNFLTRGRPEKVLTARHQDTLNPEPKVEIPKDWVGTLKRILSHGNVCSKEPITRQYDTSVQGTNALPPYSGINNDGPNDALVLTPILGKPYGLVISHGLNPVLNSIDPSLGSFWAVAEAMANYVAVGGNPREAALINNYIWPAPDEVSMGALQDSVDAVCFSMDVLEIPVISGKDSLSSTYRIGNRILKIPPVLCISVFGRIPDVEKTVTSDIKQSGSTLVLVGAMSERMGGSTYYDINGYLGNDVPIVDIDMLPKVLDGVYQAISSGEVLACHDVSEGGVVGAISEMCFGGDCGVDLDLPEQDRPDMFLFNETAGCFVVEVKDQKTADKLFGKLPHMLLGQTKADKTLSVNVGDSNLFNADIDELKAAWKQPLKEVFG